MGAKAERRDPCHKMSKTTWDLHKQMANSRRGRLGVITSVGGGGGGEVWLNLRATVANLCQEGSPYPFVQPLAHPGRGVAFNGNRFYAPWDALNHIKTNEILTGLSRKRILEPFEYVSQGLVRTLRKTQKTLY